MRKLVLFVAMGIAVQGGLVAGGCSDGPQPPIAKRDPIKTGSLSMQLQTVSDSGKVYRLRQAVFPVGPSGGVIFGTGASSGTAGFAGAPAIDAGVSAGGVAVGSGGSVFGTGGIVGSTGGSVSGSPMVVLTSEDDPNKAVLEAFLNPGSYQIQLLDGWFVEQVDELLGTATPVAADLLSSSIQFFDIQSDVETFVKFDFEVDGRRVTFGPPGRLIVGIGVQERNGNAFCGNGVIDPGESCDGNDLGFQTCASVTLGSLPNGFLFCSPFCSFDLTFCSASDGGFGGSGGTFGGDAAAGAAGIGGFGGTFGDAGLGGFSGSGGKAVGSGGAIAIDAGASAGSAGQGGGRGR